ncbi:MAG: MBL fold metallo-hydrolase [Ornithinimicrobium sp.]|uniref:MBL fold metallo-hydrolase n=1 Tax=Ornithinimicrobium sp. TaxID=1977084 RepID=UPI0026DFC9C1|nr:MBL fold metallo-hydrolase [Ornithinimicrobium sp.]MDO5738691.1 MBL fold metallo-hydrolase [Ornithinimicrobium sp.]
MSARPGLIGHVRPNGPSWRLDLGRAVVRKCSVSQMDNNVYLITCAATGERLLIDAADDADRILGLLGEDAPPSAASDGAPAPVEGQQGSAIGLRSARLEYLLTTHQHWDHHRALVAIRDATGAQTLAGEADADALPVTVDRRLVHADTIGVGDLRLAVIGLAGHTPGSVALALRLPDQPTVIFSGDSLFPGGPGRTPETDAFANLMDDLETRIFAVYDDDTIVLPGHGDNTTLGQERPSLPDWRTRGW